MGASHDMQHPCDLIIVTTGDRSSVSYQTLKEAVVYARYSCGVYGVTPMSESNQYAFLYSLVLLCVSCQSHAFPLCALQQEQMQRVATLQWHVHFAVPDMDLFLAMMCCCEHKLAGHAAWLCTSSKPFLNGMCTSLLARMQKFAG